MTKEKINSLKKELKEVREENMYAYSQLEKKQEFIDSLQEEILRMTKDNQCLRDENYNLVKEIKNRIDKTFALQAIAAATGNLKRE